MRWWPLLWLAVACEPPESAPCDAADDPLLEATPSGTPFGEHTDGGPLIFAPPPQGGAPYAAIDIRVAGLAVRDGVLIELAATDLDSGDDLGEVSYPTRLVCANVGDSAGHWLASDVHHRFFGWTLEELPDRSAEVVVRVTDSEDESLEVAFEATLVSWEDAR